MTERDYAGEVALTGLLDNLRGMEAELRARAARLAEFRESIAEEVAAKGTQPLRDTALLSNVTREVLDAMRQNLHSNGAIAIQHASTLTHGRP